MAGVRSVEQIGGGQSLVTFDSGVSVTLPTDEAESYARAGGGEPIQSTSPTSGPANMTPIVPQAQTPTRTGVTTVEAPQAPAPMPSPFARRQIYAPGQAARPAGFVTNPGVQEAAAREMAATDRGIAAQEDAMGQARINQQLLAQQQQDQLAQQQAANAARQAREADRQRQASQLSDRISQLETEAAAKAEVNPNRYLSDRRNRTISAVSVLLGAIAGPDSAQRAMDRVNQEIDRDMEAQRSSATAAGMRAQSGANALERFRLLGADQTQAEQLATAEQQRIYAGQIEAMGRYLGTRESEANARSVADGLRAQAEQRRQQVLSSWQYDPGQRATGGGARMETDTEYTRRLSQMGEMQDAYARATGGEMREERTAREREERAAGIQSARDERSAQRTEESTLRQTRLTQQVAADTLGAQLAAMADAGGMTRNPETGRWEATGTGPGMGAAMSERLADVVQGVGTPMGWGPTVAAPLRSQQAATVRDSAALAARSYLNMEGITVNEAERDWMERAEATGTNPQNLARFMNQLQLSLDARRRALENQTGSAGAAALEQRRTEAQSRREALPPPQIMGRR